MAQVLPFYYFLIHVIGAFHTLKPLQSVQMAVPAEKNPLMVALHCPFNVTIYLKTIEKAIDIKFVRLE